MNDQNDVIVQDDTIQREPKQRKRRGGKRKADPTLMHETKAEKFVRLAVRRTNKSLKALRQVENLANKAAYEYTESQAQTVVMALQLAVKRITEKFINASIRDEEFSL